MNNPSKTGVVIPLVKGKCIRSMTLPVRQTGKTMLVTAAMEIFVDILRNAEYMQFDKVGVTAVVEKLKAGVHVALNVNDASEFNNCVELKPYTLEQKMAAITRLRLLKV